MRSLKCNLLIWNDKYLAALIGFMFNDLAPNKYALSIIQYEAQPFNLWKNMVIFNDAKNLRLEHCA